MSFGANVIVPILQLGSYLFMGGGLFYLISKGIKIKYPDIKWILKYSVFRKKYKEEDVLWCMETMEKNIERIDLQKFLLINGKSVKRTNELLYILNQVQKKQKGGKEKYGKFRQGNEQIEKIPNFKR